MMTARMKCILPAASRLNEHDCCLVSVSLHDPLPSAGPVLAALRWAGDNFGEICLLVGDSLFGMTLAINSHWKGVDAHRVATAMGDEFINEVRRHSPTPLLVKRSSAVMGTAAGIASRIKFEDAYRNGGQFTETLRADAREFCARQERKGQLFVAFEKAVELSCHYLIEELAIYEVLVEEGWALEAHIGPELPTLRHFLDGSFAGLSPALERRVYVELGVAKSRIVA